MDKKTICLLTYDLTVTGGVEQMTTFLANSLVGYYRVIIVGMNGNPSDLAYSLNPEIQYICLGYNPHRMLKLPSKICGRLCSVIEEHQVNLVILMGTRAGYASMKAQKKIPVRFVYSDHGSPLFTSWDIKYEIMRSLCILCSDKVVTLSKQTENSFHLFLCQRRKKFKVMNNWVEAPANLKRLPYAVDSHKIITVARLSKEKGLDLLVRVAELVFREISDWTWDIYGDGEEREQIEEQIEKRGLADRVHLCGNDINVRRKYGEYSFMVLTSYREGMPLVLIEAKQQKLPVISFDVRTGPSEIIQNGLNGYLIKPYRIDRMADKIIELIRNPKLRQQFSSQSCLDEKKFSKESIVNQWVALIEENMK